MNTESPLPDTCSCEQVQLLKNIIGKQFQGLCLFVVFAVWMFLRDFILNISIWAWSRLGKKQSIVFVTGNDKKFQEISLILNNKNLRRMKIDLQEIQGEPEVIAQEKAKNAYAAAREPVIIEDTSFSIDGLNGMPGPYVKYCLGASGNDPTTLQKMAAFSDTKSASVRCVFAFRWGPLPAQTETFEAVVHGKIISEGPGRGDRPFGYDTVFIPEGSDKTYAEMSIEEKNKFSSRRMALELLRNHLNNSGFN